MKTEHAQRIKEFVSREYVSSAQKAGKKRFTVRAGEVVKALSLKGRAPAVCSALRARDFLRNNQLRIVGEEGPPSGQSTSVAITYEFDGKPEKQETVYEALMKLAGSAKEMFAELGGGVAFIRRERSAWKDPWEELKK